MPGFAQIGKQLICCLDDLAQANFAGDVFQYEKIQISYQTIPGCDPISTQTHHAVDTSQRHATQNEGGNASS
jgi:hypothetical protein